MKTNKYILGLATIGIAMTAGVASVGAYQGNYTVEGPNCTEERHEAMEVAFDTTSYTAWFELMGDKGRVAQVVNEGNFASFAEAHTLAKAGNYEKADAIRQELGLRGKDGVRMNTEYKGGNGDRASMSESGGQGQGQGQGRGNK